MSQISRALAATGLALLASGAPNPTASAAADAKPYKIVNTAQEMGTGGIDYVYADSDGRRLYVPRGASVRVFDLDTLKPAGSIPGLKGGHGVAVDPKSHRGFSSSNPVLMWDTKTLETVKSIQVEGRPDGILFEPLTERIYVLSHAAPNVTVLDGKDGSIVGTIDLGGAPEQAASDGEGHVYVDLEDKDSIAVVDVKEMKVTGKYDIAGKGGGPGGLGLDAKNHILFAFCHNPQNCVVLSATDGKIITTLPIGRGTDGGGFNPNTMEAFSSQGDGTLTIIKETSPTTFEVEQTVQTKARAKTCTLDTKTDQIVLITTERPPAPAAAPAEGGAPATPAAANPPAAGGDRPAGGGDRPAGDRPGGGGGGGGGQRGGRGGGGPAMLDILVVGR